MSCFICLAFLLNKRDPSFVFFVALVKNPFLYAGFPVPVILAQLSALHRFVLFFFPFSILHKWEQNLSMLVYGSKLAPHTAHFFFLRLCLFCLSFVENFALMAAKLL